MSQAPLSSESVLDAVQHLVRVPSVNPAIAPDEAHGEAAVAAAASAWLTARGVRAWTEEIAPGRVNAVAEVGDGGGPTLVLCAHLDTVATAGMTIPPFNPEVRDGRVYGRGAYDMKGSAGAIMSALAELQARPVPGRVMAALVADEEHASIGAMDFVRKHPADGCIVTEPSEGQLILAHKGFVWAEIVTTGQAAHGSRWDLGVSAIGRMARIVTALEAFDRDELRRRTHGLVGPASMHCALIDGGTGLSTYAPECRLKVERRTIPGETPDQVARELEAIVAASGEAASVTCFFDRPPLVCDRTAPIVACVRDAVAEVVGREPVEAGVAFWMDAAVFAQAGIPTVNYGPTGEGAHAAVEWVDLASVVTCARVLVNAARRFTASPP
jgi:acetylornithine deacetylase